MTVFNIKLMTLVKYHEVKYDSYYKWNSKKKEL